MEIVEEFVKRARETGGANIESVTLFGSAVAGDYHPGLSNFNLLCILRDSSFQALRALEPAAKWWDKQKQPPPLCITRKEIERSTDVFTIELLDMQQHHRVLFGEDVLAGLKIPMDLHRVQVEYELREKLILLRQHVLVAAENEARLWDLLLRSAPSFATLFRHSLIALGDASHARRRDAVQALSERLGFDLSVVLQVLDVREKKLERKGMDAREMAARYLDAVEKVAAAVDLAFDENAPKRS
jgi:predicted nucleotidyltransferase